MHKIWVDPPYVALHLCHSSNKNPVYRSITTVMGQGRTLVVQYMHKRGFIVEFNSIQSCSKHIVNESGDVDVECTAVIKVAMCAPITVIVKQQYVIVTAPCICMPFCVHSEFSFNHNTVKFLLNAKYGQDFCLLFIIIYCDLKGQVSFCYAFMLFPLRHLCHCAMKKGIPFNPKCTNHNKLGSSCLDIINGKNSEIRSCGQ